MLKKFSFPNDAMLNASIALSECNRYCGRIKSCWGCSIECNDSCQWNAIPECGHEEKWNGLMVGDISQKPSMIKLTFERPKKFFLTFLLNSLDLNHIFFF